ncbi:hypothetical protein JT359_15915 [Candidatus Poribacteria bacterium]|nr:hypothetical protein [Candidatus Poribacteria bacterium]
MLGKYTTIQLDHVKHVADLLSQKKIPELEVFEPVADFEELLEFVNIHPTPIQFSQNAVWKLESVAARIIEMLAISAHESLSEEEWITLTTILLEYTEYLYTFPDSKIDREILVAGGVLTLVGCVCSVLPQSELWRLAGYGRITSTLITVNPSPDDLHLILPIDVALSIANLQNLPVLNSTIDVYNRTLNHDFRHDNCIKFPLSDDDDVFSYLNLEIPELETVHASVNKNEILAAKFAYTEYRKEYVKAIDNTTSLDLNDDYSSVTAYLNCLLQLSINPTPPIYATTKLAIATILFPELRFREQLISLASRRYKWIIEAFFFKDGFHKDRTFKSQIDAITDFDRFLTFYNSIDDPPQYDCLEELKELIGKSTEACLYLCRPDSSFPTIDGEASKNDSNVTDLCNIPYSDRIRDDLTYILSSGKGGKLPNTLSYAMPDSGYFAMRDSWDSDAQYLFFDCGQLNNPKLDFHLFAHGRQLLTNYNNKIEDTTDITKETRWISSSGFDYVEGWIKTVDFEQKRCIFYPRGGYYIIHDLTLGNDEYRYEQTFSLTSNSEEKAEHKKESDIDLYWTESSGLSNIYVGVVNTNKISSELHQNQLLIKSEEKCPISTSLILFPMKLDSQSLPSISQVHVNSPIDVISSGFTIDYDNTVDLFLISDDGFTQMSTTVNGKRIEFEGEYLFLRGKHFIMLNAKYLKIETEVIVELDEPTEYHLNIS